MTGRPLIDQRHNPGHSLFGRRIVEGEIRLVVGEPVFVFLHQQHSDQPEAGAEAINMEHQNLLHITIDSLEKQVKCGQASRGPILVLTLPLHNGTRLQAVANGETAEFLEKVAPGIPVALTGSLVNFNGQVTFKITTVGIASLLQTNIDGIQKEIPRVAPSKQPIYSLGPMPEELQSQIKELPTPQQPWRGRR